MRGDLDLPVARTRHQLTGLATPLGGECDVVLTAQDHHVGPGSVEATVATGMAGSRVPFAPVNQTRPSTGLRATAGQS